MIIKAQKNGKDVDLSLVGKYGYKCVRVWYSCDGCGEVKETVWYALHRKDRVEHQYCRKCTIKRNGSVQKRKDTCTTKYGSDNPMKVEKFVDKFKQSNCDLPSQQRVDVSVIRESFESKKYILDADLEKTYVNNKTPINYICPKGHDYSISWNSWINGRGCFVCGNRLSRAEQEIFDLIEPSFTDTIRNDRTIIKPFELDLVIPSKKLAIEYCGLYWHSEKFKKSNYHLDKLEKCTKAGYDLITIFEDEWLNRRDVVASRLLYKLGISNSERIAARKCEIREISPKVKNEFINKHHLQGADTSKVKLGAFYSDRLISVMTFGKPNVSRRSDNEWELNRFCTDFNVISAGMASKLFKHFVKCFNPKTMVTYGDKRWSRGNLYQYLGFEYSHDSKPNYWYIVGDKRVHRFNFRKSVLSNKLENFNKELTERENMRNAGYRRIYDCGNTAWKWSQ